MARKKTKLPSWMGSEPIPRVPKKVVEPGFPTPIRWGFICKLECGHITVYSTKRPNIVPKTALCKECGFEQWLADAPARRKRDSARVEKRINAAVRRRMRRYDLEHETDE